MWDEGEEPHHQQLHRRFDIPTTAVQENGTYGGQGKATGVPLAALLSLNFSLFVLVITSQDIDSRSDVWVSGMQGRWIHVPHTAKRRETSASAPQKVGAFFFWRGSF